MRNLLMILVFCCVSIGSWAQTPEFTSTPVETGTYGVLYTYNITTSGSLDREVLLTSGLLPNGITLTDNGDGTASLQGTPTETGSFPVELTVREILVPSNSDAQSFTLEIAKATATVTLGTTSVVYTGSQQSATATTDPEGLVVEFTYDGSSTQPIEVGTYALVATVNDPNYTGSANGTFEITKATATVTLGTTSVVYTGSEQSATATTDPADLPVEFTYDGSSTQPIEVGTYALVATVNDQNYAGSASGTFEITKATATVTLGTTSVVYTGAQQSATATTDPAGLLVEFTYDGSSTPPVEVGTYALVATVNDQNYTGSASGTFEITKATATVTLGTTSVVYTGSQQSATATTDPAGLPVEFTYDGSSTPPAEVGTYALVATVNDPNYTGSASDTFEITKATANITFGTLTFVYDGSPKPATATTSPLGLTVNFTYDGASTAPVNAGSYAVVATIDNPNYTGSANATLTIDKAAASVTISNLVQNYDGTPKSVDVTTFPSGLETIVTYNGSSTAPSAAGSYTVVATIDETNYSGSSTKTLVINGPPTTSGISDVNVNEDAANFLINLRLVFSDVENGSLLEYTVVGNSNPALFDNVFITSTSTVRRLTLDFGANKNGTADIVVRATDSGGLWVEDQFHVSVASVQDNPDITTTPLTGVLQGATYNYEIEAVDPDAGDILTYTVFSKPAWLSFTDNNDGTGLLTGVPAVSDIGDHNVALEVSDDKGNKDTQSFTITVAQSNEKPVFTSSPITSATEDVSYTYNITSSDPDNNDRTITGANLPTWLTLTDNGNGTAVLQGTPENEHVGSHTITLKVADIFGSFSEQTFSISVANTNDAPEFTSTPIITARQNDTYVYTITTVDVDAGDTQTITSSEMPAWLTLDDHGDGTATLSGNPPADLPDDFQYDVELIVADAAGATNLQSFTITVSVNNAPEVASVTISINEDERRAITLNDFSEGYNDQDGDEISKIRIESLPGFADAFEWKGEALQTGDEVEVVNGNISEFIYEAPDHQSGQTSFEWSAYDGFSWSEQTARMNITVLAVNDKPFITLGEVDPLLPPGTMDTLLYSQGDPARSVVADTLIINDVDHVNMAGATVAIVSGYVNGEDELLYDNSINANISAKFDASQGVLTLTGTDTRSNYTQALINVQYRNTVLGFTDVIDKRITIIVTDGIDNSNMVSRAVEISEVLPDLDIVNAFTPNGDGVNDSWDFKNLDFYSVIKISVFNESGLKIFSCSTGDCKWDGTYNGTPLEAGPYFYTIDLNNGKRKYQGTVTILK